MEDAVAIQCAKCGHIEAVSADALPIECSSCGVIYAKVPPVGTDGVAETEQIRARLGYKPGHVRIEKPDPVAHESPEPRRGISLKMALGLVGSAALFIGVFLPIFSAPIVGSKNYFQNGQGDGTIILALAVASLVLVIARRPALLWLTGGGSLGLMILTLMHFRSEIAKVKAEMDAQLAGNPFRGLSDMAVNAVQLEWGCGVLVIGAILVLASAAVRE